MPALQDLPFKIELGRFGRLLMSPAANRHSRLQGRIERLLEDTLGGEAFPECAIETPSGVFVPDVVWMSDTFSATLDPYAVALSAAPEIRVEVMSPSNPWAEMAEKAPVYLTAGAAEAWVVDVAGGVRFFDAAGERAASALAPSFPNPVPLPGRPAAPAP